MSQLFFTKAAALRILQAQGVAACCVESIRVYKGSIQVTYLTKNGRCSTFLSKTAFYSDFIAFRLDGASNCTVVEWAAWKYDWTQNYRYDVTSNSEKTYMVEISDITGNTYCDCADHDRQLKELGNAKVGCKHILATLNQKGFSNLAEYIDAVARRAKADLFGEETDTDRDSIDPVADLVRATRSLALASCSSAQKKSTKYNPDPFGGFSF